MPTSKSRKKKPPKRVLALPDLEHAKTAVLNSLSSASGQRTYEHAIREFVAWYCSDPGSPSIAPWCSDIGSTSNSSDTDSMSSRRSSLPCCARQLLFDLIVTARQNFVLHKQLALYRERRTKPRRADTSTRVALVLLSQFLDWRPLFTVVKTRDADPVAPSGLATVLAPEVSTRPADHSGRSAAADRRHGRGQTRLGARHVWPMHCG